MTEIEQPVATSPTLYIDSKEDNDMKIKFTLKNLNVSIVNALRRTILSDVPTLAFKTFPHNENLAIFHKNTSRLNNEILKQRLACIPIHIRDHALPIDELEVEVNVQNTQNVTIYVTTQDFKIKNTTSGKYLEESTIRKIFPPDPITGDFIIFARLRPRISNEVPGEEISLTAKMSAQTARDDGSYNVCSVCSYSFTGDKLQQDTQWQKYLASLPEEDKDPVSIIDVQKNWYNLQAKRFYVKDSFDFIIESIGVFSGAQLMRISTSIILQKLADIEQLASKNTLSISKSKTTMPNSFDLVLENEGYTMGKILEYLLNKNYYNDNKLLSFVGFRQNHPHDKDSVIRVAFYHTEEANDEEWYINTLNNYIQRVCSIGKSIFQSIHKEF